MAVSKNILSRNEYLVWDNSNMVTGDILGVYESLGNREANSVTITASGSDVSIKFNVAEKVYQTHESVSGVNNIFGNAGLLGADAAFFTSPVPVDELDNSATTPALTIFNGETHQYTKAEMGIRDIKIETLAPSTRIIVT